MNYEWKVETVTTGPGLQTVLNEFEKDMYRVMNILTLGDHIYVVGKLDR